MKSYRRTKNLEKIVEGMDKVMENLMIYKKRMNSEIVVLKGNKIVKIKPE